MKKLVLKKLPGRIYKKRNKRPDGTFTEHSTWTVRYKGKDYASRETDAKKAEDFLRKLIGGVTDKPKPWQAGLLVVAESGATGKGAKIAQVLDLFVTDSRLRGLASANGNEGIVRNYLKPFFGGVPADDLTTTLLNNYKLQRLATDPQPANGTINRELGALKRALNYCMDEHEPPLLRHFPKIVMLEEATPRQGILEHRDYVRLRHAMPEYWEPVFVCAYHVGRRRGELLNIDLVDVVMEAEQPFIRVYGDATKNGKPSQIPIYGDMTEVLREQIRMTRRDYPTCKLLFHKDGNAIQKNQAFYEGWNTACKRAGVELLFHDLRRTACTMMIEAGIDEQEAMRISGHKTPSAFRRYHIVRSTRMTGAVQKAAAYLATEQAKTVESGTVYWPGSNSKPV